MSIDFEILKRAKGGDDLAIESLLKENKGLVIKIARKYFLMGGTEEDIIQEGMIGLFKAIKTFDMKKFNNFGAYASTLIEREICSAIRRENTQGNLPLNGCIYIGSDEDLPADVNPESAMLSSETTKDLIDLIKSHLSDFENQVVNMYLDGYDYLAISEKLNKTPKQIDNALARIKTKLRAIKEKL